MAELFTADVISAFFQVLMIDLVLAGDNAIVIGMAAAGLLDGKRGTTHWYYLNDLLRAHPSISYVADRRVVTDRGVATSTGISASMPMMLMLIEAIAGRQKAEAVAGDLGLPYADPASVLV